MRKLRLDEALAKIVRKRLALHSSKTENTLVVYVSNHSATATHSIETQSSYNQGCFVGLSVRHLLLINGYV